MLTNKKLSRVIFQLPAAAVAVTLISGCSRSGPGALLEGKRLEDGGNYAAAVRELQTAVQLMPTNAAAWNYLGVAYHRSGEPAKALQAYDQSIKLDREAPAAHYNLGCLLLENPWERAPEFAKNELIFFTAHRGNFRDGWVKLGAAELRLGELPAAEKCFAEAQRSGQSAEVWNDLGMIEAKKGRHTQAAAYFNAALKLEPAYGPAILNLAVEWDTHLNNRAFALRKYEDYLALKPRPANWSAVEAIVTRLDREINPPPPPPRVTSSPPVQISNQPVAVAESLARTNPPPAEAPPRTAAALSNAPGRTIAATTNAPLKNPPANPPKPIAPATNTPVRAAALNSAHPDVARTEPPAYHPPARPASNPEPTELVRLAPAPVFKVAENPAPATIPPPAAPPASNAVPAPRPPPTNLAAAAAIPSGGTNSPAAPAVTNETPKTAENPATNNAAPAGEPAAPEKRGLITRLNPLNLFHRTARTDEPMTTLTEGTNEAAASDTTPKPPAPSFERYTYSSPPRPPNGNRVEAERLFAQGVEAQRTRRPGDAELSYQEAAKADPAFFEAQLNLGLAAFERGDLPQSLAAYEMALAIKPDSFNARFNFALALKKANYITDAVQELERLLAAPPADQSAAHLAMAHLTLANLYAQQYHEPAPARKHYLKVLALEPGNQHAAAIRNWLRDNP